MGFDIAQYVGVLSYIEEGRESGVVKLVGETAIFRRFGVEDRLKQMSKAGRTPMTPIRTFEISVVVEWLGLG